MTFAEYYKKEFEDKKRAGGQRGQCRVFMGFALCPCFPFGAMRGKPLIAPYGLTHNTNAPYRVRPTIFYRV